MKSFKNGQLYLGLAKWLAALTLTVIFFSCAGTARNIIYGGLGKAADAVPFMENARTGYLSSGMRYYLLENTYPEGRAFLTLAVNAGSVLEAENERGLAHFVEHMAFNGTARFPGSELVNYLRTLGMRFGPEVNAYTSFNETVYGIEVPVEAGPAGRKIIPERALTVIDDWTWGVNFDSKSVDAERLVIMEEYRARLGAMERIRQEMYPVLFRGSPYARRLPIGIPEVIENAPAERLEEFYRRWYRPQNMALIIVGDFDAAYLEAHLEDYFPVRELHSSLGAFNRPVYNLSEPAKNSLNTLILTDSELSSSRIDLYWKMKAEKRRSDLGYYRGILIDFLIGNMLSLRFNEAVTKPETPYAYAGAGMANYGDSSRYYIFAAQAKNASVRASLRELLLIKESLIRYGFTQDEANIASAALMSYMEQLVSEKDHQHSNDFVGMFTRHFLNGETVPDIEWEREAVSRLLPGITLREINSAVKNYFSGNDLTVFISAPEAERDLPNEAEIKALVQETARAQIAPPSAGRTGGELLPRTPEAGFIAMEAIDSETGAIRWVLGNGAEVILKETRNRNSELSLYAQARGGTFSADEKDAVSAALASGMLSASGLGSFSRPDLTRMLADKQASVSFWTQDFLRGFRGEAAVRDVKTLFEMLYLGFTQPRFDSDAVAALMDQLRSQMTFQENDPNMVFSREISRATYGNPLYHPLELADLEKVNPDAAMAFIRSCLNPADYTFVFTGNLDLPLLRSLTETYLASIPRSSTFNQWADTDPMRPTGHTREIRKGREERSTVYLEWISPQVYSEDKNAVVSVLSEYLNIRLTEEIREARGGVYSVSSRVSLSPIPRGERSGVVYFICDPRRVDELITAVKDEFQKIAGGTIDREIFAKAAEALVKAQEESVQNNMYLAQSYANSAVIYESPLNRLDKRPALYRAVSPADIQAEMTELLRGSLYSVILYPETD